MFKALKTIGTPYPELDRVQDFVSQALTPILNSEIADGVLIRLNYDGTNPVISTSGTMIVHGLNRPIRGWLPVRLRTNAVIYENSTQPPDANNMLSLSASANVTTNLSLWVF